MDLIRFLAKRSLLSLLIAVIAGLAAGICTTALLVLVNSALSRGGGMPLRIAMMFAGLCVLTPAFRSVSQLLLIRVTQKSIAELRISLSRQILGVPLRKLEEFGVARILAVLTEDIGTITNLVANLPILVIDAAIVFACLAYLLWVAWLPFVCVLGFMVAAMGVYQLMIMNASTNLMLARKEHDTLIKNFRGMLEGLKELKIHRPRRQVFLSEVLEGSVAQTRKHIVRGMTSYTVASSVGELFVFMLLGLLVFFGPALNVPNPILAVFTIVLIYCMGPLDAITNLVPQIERAGIAAKNVERLGYTPELKPIETVAAGAAKSPRFEQLDMRGVSYAYSSGEGAGASFDLGPLDLSLAAGELVFLTGGNGSGKTTLAKILTGLYRPDGGEILLNNQVVNGDGTDEYRQCFSVLFQDFYLFEALMGLHAAGLDDHARRLLVELDLQEKVQVKDGVLSTTELSRGQRKRLALLTAYLEDRPVYLFDEWAADQDPSFKDIFYNRLLPDLKARGKTILVISHDDRYYDIADRVIKMEAGKIVSDTMIRSTLSDAVASR